MVDELRRAWVLMDSIRGFSRQTLGGDFDPALHASPALLGALTRATGFSDFGELETALLATETRVRHIFDEKIAAPASKLPPQEEDHGKAT